LHCFLNRRFGEKNHLRMNEEDRIRLLKICKLFIQEKNFPNEIVGRLGGDEFALLYSGNELPDRKEFISRIYRCFDEFNATSEKEYNVTVSAGACPIYANMDTELQDALAIADEKQYVDKQNRVKNVVKNESAKRLS